MVTDVPVAVTDVNLVVPPSNALTVNDVGVAGLLPSAFAVTDCACGETDTSTFGTAFLTFDNVIVSVKVLLVPSESVTTAVIATVVEFVPSAKVLPFNVTKPLAAVVDILAISEEVAVNVVIVKLFVEPLYNSETVTVAFANASICTPVDFAVTDCALFVVEIVKIGAAFLTFEYVISFEELIIVPPPSWYFTNKVNEPLSADRADIE
jgi:hypothetical protein